MKFKARYILGVVVLVTLLVVLVVVCYPAECQIRPMQPLFDQVTAAAPPSPIGYIEDVEDVWISIEGPYAGPCGNDLYAFIVIRDFALQVKCNSGTHAMQTIASYYVDVYAKAFQDVGMLLSSRGGAACTPTSNMKIDHDGQLYRTSTPEPYVAVEAAYGQGNRIEVSVKECAIGDHLQLSGLESTQLSPNQQDRLYRVRVFISAHGFTSPATITSSSGKMSKKNEPN